MVCPRIQPSFREFPRSALVLRTLRKVLKGPWLVRLLGSHNLSHAQGQNVSKKERLRKEQGHTDKLHKQKGTLFTQELWYDSIDKACLLQTNTV